MSNLSLEKIDELRAADKAKRRAEKKKKRLAREQRQQGSQAPNVVSPPVAPESTPDKPPSGLLPPSQVPPRKSGEPREADKQETVVIDNPAPRGTGTVTVPPSRVPAIEAEARPAETEIKPEPEPRQTEDKRRREKIKSDAEAELRQTFPGLRITEFKLYDEEMSFLEEFGDEAPSIPDLIRLVLDDFLTSGTERGNIEVKLFGEGMDRSGMSKGVQIIATAPKVNEKVDAFGINQVYKKEDGKSVLHIETITVEGRGKEFFKKSVMPQVLRYGISKITLDAAMAGSSQVGSFAWARYGFVPVPEAWNAMREDGQAALEEERYSSIPRKVMSQVTSIFEDPSPKALRRLIFLSWKERLEGGGKPGPVALLLTRVLGRKWTGELDLTDPKSRQWLEIYLSVTKAEDRLADFKNLLEPPTPTTGFLSGLFSRFKRK